MASLPTGSDKLLVIRTANIDIVIKNKGRQPASTWKTDGGVSTLKVVGVDIQQISIPAQGLTEEYSNHQGHALHECSVMPLFFEQTDYVVTIRSRNGESLAFRSNSSLIEGRVNNVLDEDDTLLSGVINFRNNVGFSDLIVFADGRRILSLRIEVFPTKVSYRTDYQEMMADINNMISESVLNFMKETYQVFVPDHKRNDVPAVFFTVLQAVFDKYLKAANRILAVPHHKLVSEHVILPHYKAARIDARSRKWLQKHPEYVKKSAEGFQAEKALSVKKKITYDTQENQLVKFMLNTTAKRIDDFSLRYRNSRQNPDTNILNGADMMARELKRMISTTFLSEVSEFSTEKSMSLVFGMAPGYRELYKYYLLLLNGITVGGDVFHMSVRETSELYEYWCFIKLYDILRSRYTLNSPDIIKVDRKGITIDLVKGKPSRVTFLNTQTGEQLYLSYNPSETATQTVDQRPDNVLELEKKGSGFTYKYVFDAKYRIEMNPDGKYYPDKKPGPKVDDINTMHRYRDSIVYENPESRFTFEKTMFGAYILFPYSNEEEYRNHRFYQSIEKVNIGGLPFLPSATKLVTELLEELVSDSPESAFERASLPVGIEERLKTVDWNRRDVLIGYVPDEEYMDTFLNNKIYYTRKFDTDNLPLHYVALYEKGKGINWYGELISWSHVRRDTLPGQSTQCEEMYHAFSVLKWHRLEKSIRVSEHGPNPISYTNYFLLSHSSNYSELLLKNEAEYRFFTELKRRTNEMIIEDSKESTAFEFDGAKVLLNADSIYVYDNEKPGEKISIHEFTKRPNASFRRIQRYVEKLSNEIDLT